MPWFLYCFATLLESGINYGMWSQVDEAVLHNLPRGFIFLMHLYKKLHPFSRSKEEGLYSCVGNNDGKYKVDIIAYPKKKTFFSWEKLWGAFENKPEKHFFSPQIISSLCILFCNIFVWCEWRKSPYHYQIVAKKTCIRNGKYNARIYSTLNVFDGDARPIRKWPFLR